MLYQQHSSSHTLRDWAELQILVQQYSYTRYLPGTGILCTLVHWHKECCDTEFYYQERSWHTFLLRNVLKRYVHNIRQSRWCLLYVTALEVHSVLCARATWRNKIALEPPACVVFFFLYCVLHLIQCSNVQATSLCPARAQFAEERLFLSPARVNLDLWLVMSSVPVSTAAVIYVALLLFSVHHFYLLSGSARGRLSLPSTSLSVFLVKPCVVTGIVPSPPPGASPPLLSRMGFIQRSHCS